MLDHHLEKLAEFGDSVRSVFLWPGEGLLSLFQQFAPETVAIMTIGHGSIVVPTILALFAWTVVIMFGLLILRTCQAVYRRINAILRTIVFRTTHAFEMIKMRLRWRLRRLLPRRKNPDDQGTPLIEFDDIEIAVLRSASSRGPGFALSAPELAEQFTLRPAQVQRRLDRLSQNKMITSVLGSTDGYENYRLTNSGEAFIAMWQRQHAHA